MAEVWANDAKTTLQAAIGPSDTELVLTDPSKFPATGNFRLRVDTGQNVEYMLGTARSGSTVTVTRGIEGSTAIAHAINVACVHTLTAGSLETLAAGGSVDATAVTYEPGTPGNWSPAPTEVAAALDQLAARSTGGRSVDVGNNADVDLSAATGDQYVVFRNLTAGHACKFPTAPSVGQKVTIKDYDGTGSTFGVTPNPQSFDIDGVAGGSGSLVLSATNGLPQKFETTYTFISNSLGWGQG